MRHYILIISLFVSGLLVGFTSYLAAINAQSLQYNRRALKTALLQRWFSRHHTFIPGSDHGIEYSGRWTQSPNLRAYQASFTGTSLMFTVHNTTSVQLALSNTSPADHDFERTEKGNMESQLVLTPTKTRSKRSGPVNIVVSINSSSHVQYHKRVTGIVTIARSLDQANIHTFKITLCEQLVPSTMQFEGIWVDQGGYFLHPTARAGLVDQAHVRDENRPASSHEHQTARRRRQLIEIIAPSTMLCGGAGTEKVVSSDASWPFSWSNLLLEHEFVNTTVSVVPVPISSCITRQCQNVKTKDPTQIAPMATEIFFRAGSPGTDLYRRLWSFGSSPNNIVSPAGLILILGIADIAAFLDSAPRSKHEVDRFMDDFGRTYSNFIQTIRRTMYSSSSLSTHQIGLVDHPEMAVDESFLYNSAPSTVPIFLVLQPLPSFLVSTRTQLMRTLLHHATSKVINELKWHIGDRKTFIVDTAGWLRDQDYQQTPEEETASSLPQFSLTQTGHVKFAHYMSLHLCHYLLDRPNGKTNCPFDRHDDYIGNLYVPETAGIGKLLEEMKVKEMKKMFGVL